MNRNKSAPDASGTSRRVRGAHVHGESVAELREQANRLGVQFVFNELEMALTFLDIGYCTRDVERRQRLFADAQKAHDTVQRFFPRFIFSESEVRIVNRKLQLIRARLNSRGLGLGEHTSAGPGFNLSRLFFFYQPLPRS